MHNIKPYWPSMITKSHFLPLELICLFALKKSSFSFSTISLSLSFYLLFFPFSAFPKEIYSLVVFVYSSLVSSSFFIFLFALSFRYSFTARFVCMILSIIQLERESGRCERMTLSSSRKALRVHFDYYDCLLFIYYYYLLLLKGV